MKCNKEDILDEQHWIYEEFTQRMKVEDWKTLILNYDDQIIFKGRVVRLSAKSIGAAVVEVYKDFEKPLPKVLFKSR